MRGGEGGCGEEEDAEEVVHGRERMMPGRWSGRGEVGDSSTSLENYEEKNRVKNLSLVYQKVSKCFFFKILSNEV